MKKYRKRPLVIEAAQWDGEHLDGQRPREVLEGEWSRDGDILYLRTLEGVMLVNPGSWVIKGVRGEFYPCKNDIFQATYEEEQTTPPEPVASMSEEVKLGLKKQFDEVLMRERFDQVVKDIVIKAAMEKETILRQSVKELLREVLQEIEQTTPQESA